MPPLPPACARFHALFREHWQAGTGRNPSAKWTPRTFADAMGVIGYKSHDLKTTRSWLEGTTWPTRSRTDAILDIFFPDAPSKPRSKTAEVSRDAMEAAWHAGQEARSRFALSATGQPGAEWLIEEPKRYTDLAGIDLHLPQRTNSGNYRLDVSLRFAPGRYSVDDFDITVGLTEALVSIVAPGFAIAQNSLINERTDLPNFKPAVSGAAIIGPRENEGRHAVRGGPDGPANGV